MISNCTKLYFPDTLTCWMSLWEPTEGCLASVWLAAVDSGSTVTADIGQAYRHSRRYLLSWLSRSWWIYRSHLTSAGCLEWKWGEPWWMDDNVLVVHVGGAVESFPEMRLSCLTCSRLKTCDQYVLSVFILSCPVLSYPPHLSSGQAGAAVLSELQADFHAGGRPRPNTQHQGSAPQIRQRARTVQWRLGESQKVCVMFLCSMFLFFRIENIMSPKLDTKVFPATTRSAFSTSCFEHFAREAILSLVAINIWLTFNRLLAWFRLKSMLQLHKREILISCSYLNDH